MTFSLGGFSSPGAASPLQPGLPLLGGASGVQAVASASEPTPAAASPGVVYEPGEPEDGDVLTYSPPAVPPPLAREAEPERIADDDAAATAYLGIGDGAQNYGTVPAPSSAPAQFVPATSAPDVVTVALPSHAPFPAQGPSGARVLQGIADLAMPQLTTARPAETQTQTAAQAAYSQVAEGQSGEEDGGERVKFA
ncbi:hypothetical protein FHS91_003642 [Sphingobium xanthum]|jgi:hypothetical protein|uniref:hypothetical protein n=1 Tax=Sphingobium xanthum TaxID=1387165 RepID=UPI001C8C1234|nr:hypothetical protein [Sphingobium xanthum]